MKFLFLVLLSASTSFAGDICYDLKKPAAGEVHFLTKVCIKDLEYRSPSSHVLVGKAFIYDERGQIALSVEVEKKENPAVTRRCGRDREPCHYPAWYGYSTAPLMNSNGIELEIRMHLGSVDECRRGFVRVINRPDFYLAADVACPL